MSLEGVILVQFTEITKCGEIMYSLVFRTEIKRDRVANIRNYTRFDLKERLA